MTDAPAPLMFVDPAATDDTYRVCLWAAPGQGKSVAAASAPDPILVVTADRPSAYKFARKHHPDKDIRELRYVDASTLESVYRYLASEQGADVRTVIVDPISNVYDNLVDTAPLRGDGDIDYLKVNKKLLGFVQSLRKFDVNVILVAHEKLSDGKKGDGKLYPSLGGPSLINKLLMEMDIVAHIERHVRQTDDGEVVQWIGQLQPRDNLVCKESASGGALGDRRVADLSRWFEVASEALKPDDSDVPFGEGFEPAPELAAVAPAQIDPEFAADLVGAGMTVADYRAAIIAAGLEAPANLTSKDARLAFLSGLKVTEGILLSKVLGGAQDAPEGAQEAAA